MNTKMGFPFVNEDKHINTKFFNIIFKIHLIDLTVLGCKKCDCSLVLKNTDLFTIKNTREVNVIFVNINGQQCTLLIFFFFLAFINKSLNKCAL